MSAMRSLLATAATRLRAAGVEDAGRDARRLMAAALDIDPGRLALIDDAPQGGALAAFETYVAAREARRPVAQIVGRRAFWGRDFEVTQAVLDPRPETETLVARALNGPPPGRLLDLGVGSGAILVSLLAAWPEAKGLGVDASEAALAVAVRNAARHGVGGRACFLLSNWFERVEGRFDLIVSNPPYIPRSEIAQLAREVREWEPHDALTSGPSGLEAYTRIAAGLDGALAPQGRALLEFGAGQGAAVAAIFRSAGFSRVALHHDLDGRERVISVSR
jgi:release factor glutamine methyltransferase